MISICQCGELEDEQVYYPNNQFSNVDRMIKNTKRLRIFLALIIVCVISVGIVHSIPTSSVSILNTGQIGDYKFTQGYDSEIRAIFVHAFSDSNIKPEIVCQTLKDYGINTIVIEALGANYARYPSTAAPKWADFGILPQFVTAAHSRGMKIYVAMNVIAEQALPAEYMSERYSGGAPATASPIKQITRSLLRAEVEELVTKYDIDGFMFDYMRYVWADEPYETAAKNKFILDTGLSDVNWGPDTHVDGGLYRKQFMDWRTTPINELVRDMRSWMLAIKPNLKFSAATWRWPEGYPTYWRYWNGQDSTYWVKEGWMDWVAPMFYTDNVNELESGVISYRETQVGGPYGAVSVVPFIDNAVDGISTPENFAQRVNKLREIGADGWIVWRYGGPGDGVGSGAPDISNYLKLVQMPNTFAADNIQAIVGQNSATISWATSLSATSKIQYSKEPLFVATLKYASATNFNYWAINSLESTSMVNITTTTDHSITLTGLSSQTRYYYRIQSQDPSGVATSKVMTFTTK